MIINESIIMEINFISIHFFLNLMWVVKNKTDRILVIVAAKGVGFFFFYLFVSMQVRLNAVAPKEEFECSLGVDSGVRVDYKPAAKVTSSSGLISKLKIAQHKQMIEVKNTHAYEIKVKVRENLPRSQDEKIKVSTCV